MKKRILYLLLTLLTITALLPMGAFASPAPENTSEEYPVVPVEFRGTYTGDRTQTIKLIISESQCQVIEPFSATLPLHSFTDLGNGRYDMIFENINDMSDLHVNIRVEPIKTNGSYNDGKGGRDIAIRKLIKQADNGSGFTLSDGNWWIIIAGAVVIIGGIISIVVATKKKAAFAQGTGKEDDK